MALSWLGGAVALAACSSTQPDRQEMPIRASVPSTRPSPASGSAGAADRPPAPRSRGASVAIATGGVRETDYRIGLDLTKFVAPDAHIELEVLATKGSADNLRRLVDDRHVDLAIVQTT